MVQLTIQQAFDLALQHHQAGRLQEAEQVYRQILTQQPEHPGALRYLGVLTHRIGRLDIAVDLIRRAISFNPNSPGAHNDLGNALAENGQLDEAIAAYRQAIAFDPNYTKAHNNLGNVLKDKRQFDGAIAAYRHAIALNPNLPEAHSNLGIALADNGQLDEAVAAYRQAIALNPNLSRAHNNLGNALKDKGYLDDAIAAFCQAIALSPNYAEAHSNLVHTLHYHPAYDDQAIAEELRRWSRRHAEPLKKFIQAHANDHDPDRRLRIGYVSADFFGHACAYFLLPLFRHHDRRLFEVFCYAQGAQSDKITGQMRDEAQHWRKTNGLTDAQVARLVRQDQVDILVDLKLHTADNRLLVFAQKPAPVQVTWLGYPGTTGLNTIDYRLTDPHLDPPALDDAYYSERSIHLPHTFWCYDPLTPEPAVNPSPCLKAGFVTFGCISNFCKVNEQVAQLWMRVLKNVQRSRLLILCPEGGHRQLLRDLVERGGIHPDRVELIARRPRRQYLELYHRIDVGLDTFPYNGHTTSLDSFWMGVPVITLVGQTAVGRAGMSQLMNLRMPELIARTPEQYVEIAAALAGDPPRLAEIRRTLRSRMQASPLMDAERFARDVEAVYRQIWRSWCAKVSTKR
jgi:protein O-GlcNAc transferase